MQRAMATIFHLVKPKLREIVEERFREKGRLADPIFGVPTWLVLLIVGIYGLYKYFTWHFGVFKQLGIKGPRPYPLLGTMLEMMSKGLPKFDLEMQKRYGKIVGTFQGRVPVLLIYDIDILKQILIKDFGNFTNRFNPDFNEYPLDSMITVIKDDHWKHVRNILMPTFSSGKLRKMTSQVNHCTETLCSNLQKKAESKETFDFRSLCGAYTMDVIASTAFGMKIDSHNDPENQFVKMGKKSFDFQFDSPGLILFFFFPFLMKPMAKLGFTVFPKDALAFFLEAINQALESRKKDSKQEFSTDFLQMMIHAHLEEAEGKDKVMPTGEGKSNGWSRKGLNHDEILAQGFLFFLAGYETTANTLALFGYHLAIQPEIQEKLYQEIKDATKDQVAITSDLVQGLPYLDMCMNETLRMYPAGLRTDRVASNDVVINGVLIPKGMTIAVPIYAIHNDPELWPETEKFNPDRFLPEEKSKRDPLHFMPFSDGPRHCVGKRLALMEMKMSMVHVLKKFKFVKCSETEIPLQMEKLNTRSVNGIKLKVELRINDTTN